MQRQARWQKSRETKTETQATEEPPNIGTKEASKTQTFCKDNKKNHFMIHI